MVRNFGAAPIFSKNRLRFRARLPDCWITAAVTTAQQRLSDVINPDSGQIGPIAVEDVCVERGAGVEELRGEFGSLNLAHALLVIPVEEGNDGRANSFEWIRKRPNLVRVGISGYDIVGDVYLAEGQILRELIVRPTPPFLPLTAVRVRHPRKPEQVDEHRMVFVNRKLVSFIVPEG